MVDAVPTSVGAGVFISRITLTGGATVAPPPNGVTAIVGGNNTGKSTLLSQLNGWLSNTQRNSGQIGQYEILTNVEIEKTTSPPEFEEWIARNSHLQRRTPANPHVVEGYMRPGTQPLGKGQPSLVWNHLDNGFLGQLCGFLVRYIEAGNRSGNQFSVGRRQRPDDPPTDALHYLENDPQKWERLDKIYRDLFQSRLTLDKLSQNVCLRVGTPPKILSELGYNTAEKDVQARLELDTMPLVGAQGDGIKSLLSVLLPPLTASYPIVLIDEPEAFLHPPQALKLGRILGELARESNVQIIVATHDRNLLVGLMQSDCTLTVVRLDRGIGTTSAQVLEHTKIDELWSDPVLRYTNVLDGLFHRLVVAVENDRDCRFYAAALEAAHESEAFQIPPSEVLFVPTYGKDGINRLVAAFAAVGVQTVAAPDLDMLNDKSKIRKLSTTLGANWDDFDSEYDACTAFFRVPPEQILVRDVRDNIVDYLDSILADSPNRKWDSELKRRLGSHTRASESRWSELKREGIRAFPRDLGSRPANLLEKFDSIGLVMVRVGEMESFGTGYDNMASKGPEWVRSALAAGVHKSPEALAHVRRIMNVVSST